MTTKIKAGKEVAMRDYQVHLSLSLSHTHLPSSLSSLIVFLLSLQHCQSLCFKEKGLQTGRSGFYWVLNRQAWASTSKADGFFMGLGCSNYKWAATDPT